MSSVRTAARAMLAGIFVASGARGVVDPEPMVPVAKRVSDQVGPMLRRLHPSLPDDPQTLVRLDQAVKLVGGLLLVTPLRRPAALLLAGSLVPTTLAAHRFWEFGGPADRGEQTVHFLKNLGILGGLLLAAFDTEGRPGLRWRTARTLTDANRSLRHGTAAARGRFRLGARR